MILDGTRKCLTQTEYSTEIWYIIMTFIILMHLKVINNILNGRKNCS